MDKNTEIKVTNRSNASVVLRVPELNYRREFGKQETKYIPYEKIEAAISQEGGKELFYNYLFIEDKDVLNRLLGIQEEPEYWLKEEDIPNWLVSCSLNEFTDALNFAPDGIKDIIKSLAVSLPLNDMSKRDAIKTILHFDVTKVIENNKEDADDANTSNVTNNKRLVSTPSYIKTKPAAASNVTITPVKK